jgi:hypothetical protein
VGIVRRRSANARTPHRLQRRICMRSLALYPIHDAEPRPQVRSGEEIASEVFMLDDAERGTGDRVSARRGALERKRSSELPPELGVLEQRDRFNANWDWQSVGEFNLDTREHVAIAADRDGQVRND